MHSRWRQAKKKPAKTTINNKKACILSENTSNCPSAFGTMETVWTSKKNHTTDQELNRERMQSAKINNTGHLKLRNRCRNKLLYKRAKYPCKVYLNHRPKGSLFIISLHFLSFQWKFLDIISKALNSHANFKLTTSFKIISIRNQIQIKQWTGCFRYWIRKTE